MSTQINASYFKISSSFYVEFFRGKAKIPFLLSKDSEGKAAFCRRHRVPCDLRFERACSLTR
jgi:hypothetical protein